MNAPPAVLSVIVVTVGDYTTLRRVVRFLRAQTIQSKLEVVVVAPDAKSLEGWAAEEQQGFCKWTTLFVGAIDNREYASAAGIRAATASFVALIEDHAFPDPTWAERLVARLAGPWAAAGPAVVNANPGFLSWSNMLLAFAAWPTSGTPGEMDGIVLHNCAYNRDVLMSYGPRLGDLLAREGGLFATMRADGHKSFFEPAAVVHHTMPSALGATVRHQFNAGRLYAATRASGERWSMPKRLFYMALGPVLPFIQMVTRRTEVLAGRRGAAVAVALPPLFFGLTLDSAGQMFGYVFGPGNTASELARDEVIRWQHINARDTRALNE